MLLNGGIVAYDEKPIRQRDQWDGVCHFYKISRDAMTVWRHLCKFLRDSYTLKVATEMLLLSDIPLLPVVPYTRSADEGGGDEDSLDFSDCVPRSFYAGNPEPWILQGCGIYDPPEEIVRPAHENLTADEDF